MIREGPSGAEPAPPARRVYLDWLRGVAVLIMIAAHTADAWTAPAFRGDPLHRWMLFAGGIGGPLFLLLAGMTVSLAGGARLRRGMSAWQAAGRTARHGAMIFGLAFVLQLQSWVVSGGSFARKMLRVEILHVMGLALMAAALLWAIGRTHRGRLAWLASSAVVVAMMTPVARGASFVQGLPEPLQWYVLPVPGRSTFTVFPSVAFLLAGAALGQLLEPAGGPREARRLHGRLLLGGLLMAAGGYAASLLPPIYADVSFWSSSPTFFFIRLGFLLIVVAGAFVWSERARLGRSPLSALGVSSLFVYWVHLELVYGRPAAPLREQFDPLQQLAAFGLFSLALYLLVRLKRRWSPMRAVPHFSRTSPHGT